MATFTASYKQSPDITADVYLPTPPLMPTVYPVRTDLPLTPLTHPYILTRAVINIHGGAFMLGDSRMVSLPQVTDCVSRGWIVVVPNHRLCPQVDIYDGPLRDIRDCLEWVYAEDGLDVVLKTQGGYQVDREKVMAFGTSSGGMLALGLVSISPSPLNIPREMKYELMKRALTFLVHHEQFSISTVQSTTPIQPGRDPFLLSRPNSLRAYHRRSSTKYTPKPRFQRAVLSPWKDRVKQRSPEVQTFLVPETPSLSHRSPTGLFSRHVVLTCNAESRSTQCVTYRGASSRQRSLYTVRMMRWCPSKSVASYTGCCRARG